MKRKIWLSAAAGVLVVIGGVAAASGTKPAAERAQPVTTAKVTKGKLTARISMYGTLTYRGRPDGSPYPVINQSAGIYTALPAAGDKVGCGDVFYRVDDKPVLLLCGDVPAYRELHEGDAGNDVRQLNANLRRLGHDADAGDHFTGKTRAGLAALQRARGAEATGKLTRAGAIFLPEPVRVAQLTGTPGGPARAGTPVAQATSDTLEVQVALDPAQQTEVHKGARTQITLPGDQSVPGKVDRLGRVAQAPAGHEQDAGAATIPAYISLDAPEKAGGLDRAPAQVDITTTGVDNALSVPVTAIVGKSGGGYAVEVVRADGRELVTVKLGLLDTAGGRVQVEGELREGEEVVVPSL